MQIREITFDDGLPDSLTATFTLPEAVLATKMMGRTNHNEREEIYRGGGESGLDIYDVLTGLFFNRFWDDGVNEL